MDRLTPDADQIAAIEKMVQEPTRAALNASQYGTGKTLVTVEVAERVAFGGVRLIVAPLFTKHSWAATIKRQYTDAADVYFINSSKAGKEAMNTMLSGKQGWYIIGREYLASKAVRDVVAAFSPNIDFMAYDECARWANYKSAGWRMMKKMKPKYKMALSATPAGNKFSGMFTITHWLWPRLEGHDSYWKFVADHCETHEDYFSGVVVDGEKNPGHYVSSLPCYVRLEKDFGPVVEDTIYVELSKRERKVYDEFEKNLIAWIEDNPIVAKFPIVKRVRLRQMTLGEVAYDAEADTVTFDDTMKSTKYDTLVGLIEENADEPMVIFTDSQKYAHIVTEHLKRDGYRAAEWSGNVSETAREAVKEGFMDGTQYDYIVATVASIGEGVDGLQHRARFMVWLSRSDNNQLNMQAFRRLYRRGQERQVVSIDIVALNSYDEGVLNASIQQALSMNRSLKQKGGNSNG